MKMKIYKHVISAIIVSGCFYLITGISLPSLPSRCVGFSGDHGGFDPHKQSISADKACYLSIASFSRFSMTTSVFTAQKHNFTVVQSLSKAGVNLDFNQLYANFTFFKADLYASFTLKCKGM